MLVTWFKELTVLPPHSWRVDSCMGMFIRKSLYAHWNWFHIKSAPLVAYEAWPVLNEVAFLYDVDLVQAAYLYIHQHFLMNTDPPFYDFPSLQEETMTYYSSILLNIMFHAMMGRFQLELIIFITCFSTVVPFKSCVFFHVGLSSLTRNFQQVL